MTKTEFDSLVQERRRSRPLWFGLEQDEAATEDEVRRVEAGLGRVLPAQYREFLTTHGAGMFAFLKVLGVKPGTSWELTTHRERLPEDFLPVADLETGDYFGHRIVAGRCEAEVFVWNHETQSVEPTKYCCFYDLVAAVALNH